MKAKYISALCLGLFGVNLFGHDQLVHKAITANAAASALEDSAAYHSFVNEISQDLSYTGLRGATNFMVEGSFDEDFGAKEDSIGGIRSYNHFYDPIPVAIWLPLQQIPLFLQMVFSSTGTICV